MASWTFSTSVFEESPCFMKGCGDRPLSMTVAQNNRHPPFCFLVNFPYIWLLLFTWTNMLQEVSRWHWDAGTLGIPNLYAKDAAARFPLLYAAVHWERMSWTSDKSWTRMIFPVCKLGVSISPSEMIRTEPLVRWINNWFDLLVS